MEPENLRKYHSFGLSIRSHYMTLEIISKRIGNYLRNIQLETSHRQKRGILNGLGSIWKAISGNLDASDGEYFSDCIDKLEKDDKEIQNLLKNQIQIVSTTIKNFNSTIGKLNIDEENFNQNIEKIQSAIVNAQDERQLLYEQIKIINICESLLESFVLIENELRDISDSINFSKLKILHPSVIKSDDLLDQLVLISRNLDHNNLPLQPSHNNLPGLVNLITLKAFQTEKRLVFILQIPLVSNEQFSAYHLYSIPTKNVGQGNFQTGMFHAILPESKYIALSKDNRLYLRLSSLEECQLISPQVTLCKNILPLALEDAPCEVNIITELSTKKCKPIILHFEDYNIIRLKKNKWIAIVSHKLPIVSTCPRESTMTRIVETNSIITMKPRCMAYIGSTQVYAEEDKTSNITEFDIIPQVPFDCCESLPKETPISLKPIKLNSINLDELNTAAHKLEEQQNILNNLGKESFIQRHLSAFAIFTIVVIALLVTCWCWYNCGLCRRLIGYFKGSDSGNDSPPGGPSCTQIFNYCNVGSPISKRQSIHSLEEVTYQADPPSASLMTGTATRRSTQPSRKF